MTQYLDRGQRDKGPFYVDMRCAKGIQYMSNPANQQLLYNMMEDITQLKLSGDLSTAIIHVEFGQR